jgi:hypothetical protein
VAKSGVEDGGKEATSARPEVSTRDAAQADACEAGLPPASMTGGFQITWDWVLLFCPPSRRALGFLTLMMAKLTADKKTHYGSHALVPLLGHLLWWCNHVVRDSVAVCHSLIREYVISALPLRSRYVRRVVALLHCLFL